MSTKWSDDAFLDRIRNEPDQLANNCVRQLMADAVSTKQITGIFRQMRYNGAPIPDGTPPVLRDYFERTATLPPNTDYDRLDRGQRAFMTHMLPSCVVLLFKSIPEGYAAPPLTRLLNISGQLRDNPYHRLMGTLRFLIDISSPDGFEPGEGHRAIITTQKVRLMHAGVRVNVAPQWPEYDDYVQQYMIPISTEDMLGTMIGFSMLVVWGLRILRVSLGPPDEVSPYSDDEEAFYYVWRIFGRRFGIHPVGQLDSEEFIPQNLSEAKEFYDAYRRRHYVGATDLARGWRARSLDANAGGVALAQAHVHMVGVVVKYLWPRPIRYMFPGIVGRLIGRIYLQLLIGDTGCARIGVKPVPLFLLLKTFLYNFWIVWAWFWRLVSPKTHARISKSFLERLIRMVYKKDLGFIIPSDVRDLENLVETGWKQ